MIYRKIEYLRIQKNFTKEGLAKAIGKSRQWYYDIFKVKNINVEDLMELSKVFEVSICYFFENEDNVVNEPRNPYILTDIDITTETILELRNQLKQKDEQIQFLQHLIEEKL